VDLARGTVLDQVVVLVLAAARLGTTRVRVKVLQGAGDDPGAGDEIVDIAGLQTDNAAHLVGGKLSFVDEAVKGAKSYAQPCARFGGADPFDGFCRYSVILPGWRTSAVSQYFFAGFIHNRLARASC
jgi:hypothetical protein